DVSSNVYGINLTPIEKKCISGTFSLPSGVAPERLLFDVIASNGTDSASSLIFMPAGSNSVTYAVYVMGGADYKLNYDGANYSEYVNYGCYTKNGTFSDMNLASNIDVSKENQSNINIMVIPFGATSAGVVTRVNMDKVSTSIQAGSKIQLNANVLPENATNKVINWTTSDKNIATVSSTGLVTAISAGEVKIRAASTADESKYAECIVTVTAQATSTTEEGKDGGGSGTGGGGAGGGGAAMVPVEIPKPDVPVINPVVKDGEIVTVKATAKFDKDTREAKASIDTDTINKALNAANPNANGIKTVKLAVQKVEGSTLQTVEVPANILSSGNANERFEIVCEAGTVTVPSNMLGANDIKGAKNVALSIGTVDKSKLDSSMQTKIGHGPVIELNIKADGETLKWNNPDVPVTVSIPYTPTDYEKADPEHIVVWYIDDNSEVSSISNGRYDTNTGKVTFSTTHFSKYAVTFVSKTFSDIAGYPWARKPIEVMASKGIISGTSTENYTPDSEVKRGDFMLLLVKALGFSARFEGNFKDVKPTDYYYDAVGIARKLGIAKGNGDKFNPDEVITRQDMMALIDRAMLAAKKNLSAGSVDDLNKFTDKSEISSYAAKSIASLIKNGIVTGNGTGINPLGIATRAETAVLIYRIYNK
ncbi:MAG TPA: S-layer homology domain-containing protein, partial [Clostridia bacterium]